MAENLRLKTSQLTAVRTHLTKAQGGVCAICKRQFKGKVVGCVDHDHTSGHIRGVLCRACNRLEGQVKNRILMAGGKDNPVELLRGLVEYWEHYKTPRTKYLHPTFRTESEKRVERLAKQRAAYKRKKLQGK